VPNGLGPVWTQGKQPNKERAAKRQFPKFLAQAPRQSGRAQPELLAQEQRQFHLLVKRTQQFSLQAPQAAATSALLL
jgi:hypothetical protein